MYRHIFPVADDETVMQALSRRLSRQGLQTKIDERGLVFGEFVWQKKAPHLWRVRHQTSLMQTENEACDVILIWHPLGEFYGWRLLVGGKSELTEMILLFNALSPKADAYLKLGDLASVTFCADLIQQCSAAFLVFKAQYEVTLKKNAQTFSVETLADCFVNMQLNTSLLIALQCDARAYLKTRVSIQSLDLMSEHSKQYLAQHLAQFLLSIPVPTLGELS